MVSEEEEPEQSPQNHRKHQRPGDKVESMLSPGFRSVAAMAGWDEEAILIASLVVEDTPDRNFKHKKRPNSQSNKTPPTNSRRKRRAKRSPVSISVPVLDLDEEEEAQASIQETEKKNKKSKTSASEEEKKNAGAELPAQGTAVSSSNSTLPCMDRLREELSCAICLEICFEPSTTPCGHSFCKKCLKSAADKCGKKCPKCRQLISNGRCCTVNTVLWNTIQLLFPKEVEARKAAGVLNAREAERQSPARRRSYYNGRNGNVQLLNSPEAENSSRHLRNRNVPLSSSRGNFSVRQRREVPSPSQDEDAALALRLQREEFLEVFRLEEQQQYRRSSSSSSFTSARAQLRAMASRAISIRSRGGRPT